MRASMSRSMAAPLFLFLILREPYRTARSLHSRDLGLRRGRRVGDGDGGDKRDPDAGYIGVEVRRPDTVARVRDGAAEAGEGHHGLWGKEAASFMVSSQCLYCGIAPGI